MFDQRSQEPERIDTGDYTQAEYERFLQEIRFINERLGDKAALEKTLLKNIEELGLDEFSVLDVGAGTGELLGVIADFARASGRLARLVGLDFNNLSVREIAAEARTHHEITPIRADALKLPFVDRAFDFAICSLFTHHLADPQVPIVLKEMARTSRRGIVVIDLERNVYAWLLYQLFCFAYRISPLVRHDGSLSIRKGFRVEEFSQFAKAAGLVETSVEKHAPYRVVLNGLKRD